jgi:hypothetical protein
MKNFIAVFILILMFGLASHQLVQALNLPEVYFSNYTNQCAMVMEHGVQSVNYHCRKLPVRYTKIWVK